MSTFPGKAEDKCRVVRGASDADTSGKSLRGGCLSPVTVKPPGSRSMRFQLKPFEPEVTDPIPPNTEAAVKACDLQFREMLRES